MRLECRHVRAGDKPYGLVNHSEIPWNIPPRPGRYSDTTSQAAVCEACFKRSLSVLTTLPIDAIEVAEPSEVRRG